jgi:hypothetical protein
MRDGGTMRRWQWYAMLVLHDVNAGSFLRVKTLQVGRFGKRKSFRMGV